MVDKATRFTKDTLIPVGLVTTIIVASWGLATSLARASAAIEQHERRITSVESDLRAVRDGVQRIEIKLGTAPVGKP